jgi:class 3 adenylate cyclase
MTNPPSTAVFPEERRLATVLFADIQGFTTLAERLDFEVVTDLIKAVWLKIDTVLEDHDGYIDKHIGDAVMAVWGAPYAGENDAEQAVHAGLAIQRALIELISESDLPNVSEVRLRVGINTGMVLAGYVGKRPEYTVMGNTVNVASRIQQLAEAGTVVISDATYRLVHGDFRVRRIADPLHLRGKVELVQAYLVEGVTEQPSRMRYRSLGSLETHMVGRDAELERLQKIFDDVVSSETPQMTLISGDVGMGKSRLLWEFSNWVEAGEQPVTVLSARALAQITQVPFYLWKSIWNLRFGIQDSDSQEVQRYKLLGELQKIWAHRLGPTSSIEAAHLIGSLMGIDWPDSPFLAQYNDDLASRLKRTGELTRELARRICSFSPLVLVLDDLQFADPSSLALLAGLFDPPDLRIPLMVLAGARLEFTKHNPRWLNIANLIHLEPLPVNVETVAMAYPALHRLPEEILQLIAELADGNPYFMEELAKTLLQTGMLHRIDQSGAAEAGVSTGAGQTTETTNAAGQPQGASEDRLSPAELLTYLRENTPESLRGMLQARLDGLTHETRAIALLASVSGRVFWVGAVLEAAKVMEKEGDPVLANLPKGVLDRLVQDSLRQLARSELAFPRANSTYASEQEYIFKHSMLREVAYSLIPRRLRPRYHLAVAQWLSNHRNPDMRAMAGSHYEQAQVYDEAARCYEASADLALIRGAPQEAKKMLAHARELRQMQDKAIASKIKPEVKEDAGRK